MSGFSSMLGLQVYKTSRYLPMPTHGSPKTEFEAVTEHLSLSLHLKTYIHSKYLKKIYLSANGKAEGKLYFYDIEQRLNIVI